MAEASPKPVSADEARRVAEEARESEWQAPSFLRQIFLGNFRLDLVHPFPAAPPERPEFRVYMERLERFLVEEVDPDAIDRDGEIPPAVIKGLAELGAFGMKIPKEYGGLGLHAARVRRGDEADHVAATATSSRCSPRTSRSACRSRSSCSAPRSRSRSIFPRLAKGAISAFALTEATSAPIRRTCRRPPTPTPDGTTTSSTARSSGARTARSPSSSSSWRAPTRSTQEDHARSSSRRHWPGVEVVHRCRFMGLKAIENGVIRFTNVRVPQREPALGRRARASSSRSSRSTPAG